MSIINLVREYPDIRRDYPGGMPRKLEDLLLRICNAQNNEVLHIFGGKAGWGLRGDINTNVEPDYVGDAHSLPFRSNSFKLVICDPPYSDHDNYIVYGNNNKLFYDAWISEACRVSSKYLVTRHIKQFECPKDWTEYVRIFFTLCPNRYIHLVQLFKYD